MKKPLFQGADLIITTDPALKARTDLPGKEIVLTEYAEELSELVFRLRDRYQGRLDCLNKYAFFSSLGRAANDVIARGGDFARMEAAVTEAAERFWRMG